jgi:hypothetical protein
MFGTIGQFGWPLAVLTGTGLGLWGGVSFAKNMADSSNRRPKANESESSESIGPSHKAPRLHAGSASRWELYAMIVIPLLTVPVLFALDNLILTFLGLLGNSLLLRFLWYRLTSNLDH